MEMDDSAFDFTTADVTTSTTPREEEDAPPADYSSNIEQIAEGLADMDMGDLPRTGKYVGGLSTVGEQG